jgi:hypothetical protein
MTMISRVKESLLIPLSVTIRSRKLASGNTVPLKGQVVLYTKCSHHLAADAKTTALRSVNGVLATRQSAQGQARPTLPQPRATLPTMTFNGVTLPATSLLMVLSGGSAASDERRTRTTLEKLDNVSHANDLDEPFLVFSNTLLSV